MVARIPRQHLERAATGDCKTRSAITPKSQFSPFLFLSPSLFIPSSTYGLWYYEPRLPRLPRLDRPHCQATPSRKRRTNCAFTIVSVFTKLGSFDIVLLYCINHPSSVHLNILTRQNGKNGSFRCLRACRFPTPTRALPPPLTPFLTYNLRFHIEH